jgi:hypothetical protein
VRPPLQPNRHSIAGPRPRPVPRPNAPRPLAPRPCEQQLGWQGATAVAALALPGAGCRGPHGLACAVAWLHRRVPPAGPSPLPSRAMQQRVCSTATYVREEEASKEEDEIFTECHWFVISTV